jgi:hypothetical protein
MFRMYTVLIENSAVLNVWSGSVDGFVVVLGKSLL